MIHKIIPVPKEIVKAVNENNLAVFIGAGVSRIVGCIGWDELAKKLVNLCFKLKKEDETTCINFKEKDRLLKDGDQKKTITICYNILKSNGHEDAFYDELKEALKYENELLDKYDIYKEINGLRGLFITTNADQLFDDYFREDKIIYREPDVNPENIDINKLYHIHGSIIDRSSLVFTVRQYINRYNNSEFKQFLEEVFREYTVLFLGYGMAEFELLDFLITKYDSKEKKESPRHFIIKPYYRGEENILQFDNDYYAEMGINVLGYELDENGYSQLYNILKVWNTEVNQITTYLYKTFVRIEKAVQSYDEKEASEILQIVKNDKPQEDHLFAQLAKSENAILWFKLLCKNNYFQPDNNPVPSKAPNKEGFYTIEKWNILDYLLNVAKLNKKQPDENITKFLDKIINNIIDFRTDNGERVDNTTTDRFILKITFSLPNELITEKHINWINTALQTKWRASNFDVEIGRTVLPSLIKDNDKENVLLLLDKILDFRRTEKAGSDFESILDKYWLQKALKRHKEAISEICGIEAANIATEKMKKLIAEDDSAFNYMWIPTIEDHPQTRFTDKYECQLVHFVRDILTFLKPKQIESIVKGLLKEDHPILRRIAIHLIDVHYIELKNIFWNIENPLNDDMLEHEIYELMKNNCAVFTKPEIEKMLDWIETAQYQISDMIKDDKEKIEKAIAYQKKEWLSGLLSANNPEVESEYQKYDEINPVELRYPGLKSWSESTVGSVSPIDAEEMVKKSNPEIADYLNEFKGDGGWGSPSEEGLSSTFKAYVSSDPEKFSEDLKPFVNISQYYQYDLISGFVQAWRSMREFSWENVFNFIEQILTSDEFWEMEYKDERANYRNWIISQILELIQEGTRTDSNAFNPKYLPQAEKILFIIAERIDLQLQDSGNLFKAMILYSMRYARLYKKDDKERWPATIKDYFNKLLKEVDITKDFYKVLGQYLVSLMYLDKEWVIKNINTIFPSENEEYWTTAFTNHVLYAQKVYQEIYFLLKDAGVWSQVFKHTFKEERVIEYIVQFICVSYMEGWEELDDSESLINVLITRQNLSELAEIVRFIGTFKDLTDEKKLRTNNLWKALYSIVREDESKYKIIISNLSRWVALINEIDKDVFEWLKLSAQYVEVNYNSSFFIEDLERLVKINPKEIGAIYIEMLKPNVYPTYDEDNIKNIVTTLYDEGQKEDADRICTIYMAQGYDFLKAIYEKNNLS